MDSLERSESSGVWLYLGQPLIFQVRSNVPFPGAIVFLKSHTTGFGTFQAIHWSLFRSSITIRSNMVRTFTMSNDLYDSDFTYLRQPLIFQVRSNVPFPGAIVFFKSHTTGFGTFQAIHWSLFRSSITIRSNMVRTFTMSNDFTVTLPIYVNRWSSRHRLLYTWIGHEIFGTDIRVVIAADDGCEMYLSRAENMKL